MLNEHEIKLIKETWLQVLEQANEAGNLFYEHLFRHNPEVKQLFRIDVRSQNRKLVTAITLMVARADTLEPASLTQEMRWLASKHMAYEVTEKHFAPFIESFIYMLSNLLQKAWSDELKNAWEKLINRIASAIIKAMQEINQLRDTAKEKMLNKVKHSEAEHKAY